MKLNKKWWLIIGFIAVAVISVILVVVLIVVNKNNQGDPTPETAKYTISIETINGSYGTVVGTDASNVYIEGSNAEYTITPKTGRCIQSIYIDGVNVFDYINNETLNIENAYSYTFTNITKDHTIIVKFDECVTLDDLAYDAVQTNGLNDIKYGKLSIWGASSVVPKNGRVRLKVEAIQNYDFHSFILPTERNVTHSASKDYSYIDDLSFESMTYDAETQSFIMSSPFVMLERYNGYNLKLQFVPTTIDLLVYFSQDGQTFTRSYSGKVQLYSNYIIDVNYKNGYTWYYSYGNNIIASNLREADILERDDENNTQEKVKYINLDHELYAENNNSKRIILVCVKNAD